VSANFLRRFSLPRCYRYDPECIVAKLNDGVLEVRHPESEQAKPRRVPVSGA
jgi:HSP20 family molecular chaperone IbpA